MFNGRRSRSDDRTTAGIVAYLILFLLGLAAVIMLGVLLYCCFSTKEHIHHLHSLDKCEHIARGSYNAFFKDYNHEFIHDYYTNETVICVDGSSGGNYTGYNGIKELFYDLHRLQYHLGSHFIDYGNSYAPTHKDNTCLLVLDYKCNVTRPYHHYYPRYNNWMQHMNNYNYSYDPYHEEPNGSPCDDCHAYVLFQMDDDWKVETAHVCADDIMHTMPYVSPAPSPSPIV